MSAHQLGTSDITNEYNSPLTTLSGLRSATSPTLPTQANTPTTNVASPDYMGMTQSNYANALSAYNKGYDINTAKNNAAMGGLFGLGGAVLGGLAGGPMGAVVGQKLGSVFGGNPAYGGYNTTGGVQYG